MKVTRCAVCDFPINVLGPGDPMKDDPSVIEHEQVHQEAHRDRMAAFAQFRLTPLGHDRRKLAEQQALDMAEPDNDHAVRMEGAEIWIDALFERSLEDAADRGTYRRHPQRNVFAAELPLEERWEPTIASALRSKYGTGQMCISNQTLLWSHRKVRLAPPESAVEGDGRV